MLDVDDEQGLQIVEITGGPYPALAGVADDGEVYLGGDLHPLGSFAALMKAAAAHVPYVAVSAVQVLFPASWLRAECLHDADRLRIIDNIEALLRGRG